MLGNFSCFCYCRLLSFFKINIFEKFFQGRYQSVKRFGFRSGPTLSRSWSGSKLFVKVFSRRQKVAASKGRVKILLHHFLILQGTIEANACQRDQLIQFENDGKTHEKEGVCEMVFKSFLLVFACLFFQTSEIVLMLLLRLKKNCKIYAVDYHFA